MFWLALLALSASFPEKELKLGEVLLKERYREQPGAEWQAHRAWLNAFRQAFVPNESIRYELRDFPMREAEPLPGGIVVVPLHLFRLPLAEVVESLAEATAHSLLRHGFRGQVWLRNFSASERSAAEQYAQTQLDGKEFPPLPPLPAASVPKRSPSLTKPLH